MGIDRIDYLVISGDLINSAGTAKFENALNFIDRLLKSFSLDNDRCIIVPGNHDLHWNKNGIYDSKFFGKDVDISKMDAGNYYREGKTIHIKNRDNYGTRFAEFSEDLYKKLFGKPYPLEPKYQFENKLFLDTRIQFLALNSCYKIDCFHPKDSEISREALSEALMNADSEIETAKKKGTLRDRPTFKIAVWHHPVTGGEDAIKDIDFLERLRNSEFKICLHGHAHKDQHELFFYPYKNKIYLIGAGTSGVDVGDRPKCSPYEYNLLEIDRDFAKVKVHTRCKRTESGAWDGLALWIGNKNRKFERRTFYEIEFDGLTYAE